MQTLKTTSGTKISIPISCDLLKKFDDACDRAYHEKGKRSQKIRTLMWEWIQKQSIARKK